ncbi:MAG: hypothetical protein RJA35_382, partial [Actinomycetota bacterium]
QDWELNLRIRQSGEVVWFDPRLQVEYHPRSSWKKLVRQFYDTGIWRGELTRRKFSAASLRYFAPPLLVMAILACIGLAFVWPIALSPVLTYLAVCAGLGIYAGKNVMPGGDAAMVVVLPSMHLSWGAGFLAGLIFRAKPKTGE